MQTGLKGKTMLITGGSRGIGLAIALRAARDGANIAILAKTDTPHPKLPGTIYTAAEAIEKAGGHALPIKTDIRFEEQVADAVAQTVTAFGGIDIVVNNASAIQLTPTLQTSMKGWDLMHQINARGTFLTTKTALPHLLQSANPHVLNLSPPLHMQARWFAPHVAYTMAKYGMSMCVLGMAEEFAGQVAVNALWPRTTIATAAIQNILGGEALMRQSRKPEIMADAAYIILQKPIDVTGQFFIDDEVLAAEGLTDLDAYAYDPAHAHDLMPDYFL